MGLSCDGFWVVSKIERVRMFSKQGDRCARSMSNVLKTATQETNRRAIYLDCNATTPLDPRVCEAVTSFMTEEFGNAGSRTHDYGTRAKVAVQSARDQVAACVECSREEVIFTSGATESNNLALLGLRAAAEKSGKRHIISSTIEHKAVLEPLEYLRNCGFEVTLVPPTAGGFIAPDSVAKALREDTFAVSLMHVNNETGVVQPIREIADVLADHPAFFHVDAAQSFGKRNAELVSPRLDMLSLSGHKICGPKGIGALVARRRGFGRIPLQPLMFGGGQERGLRPGTLPVHLIVGFGIASEIARNECENRSKAASAIKESALAALTKIGGVPNGDQSKALPTALNISFPGLDSEAAILALKDVAAISNGSACTSQSYTPSHVLIAMELSKERISSALRFSWCHLTPTPDWQVIAHRLAALMR